MTKSRPHTTLQHNDADRLYQEGSVVTITSHRPPPPFGCPHYKQNSPKDLGPLPSESDNQLDYVFQVHPIETKSVADPHKTSLTFEKQLFSGKPDGPRVFVCTLNPEVNGGNRVVAKIYDPLYYCWQRTESPQCFNRVVRNADIDYSMEAAAYEHAQKLGQDGNLTPKYYGSWSFNLRSVQGKWRPVRLILMEFINGPTIYQAYFKKVKESPYGPREWLPPNEQPEIPDRIRMDILARLLKITAAQRHIGLRQKDIAPRNVIAVLDGRDDTDLSKLRVQRVVLIDYNIALVDKADFARTKPRNPMQGLWRWGVSISGWDGWLPKSWHDDLNSDREWLWQTFGEHGQLEHYQPISPPIWQEIQTWLESRGQSRGHQ